MKKNCVKKLSSVFVLILALALSGAALAASYSGDVVQPGLSGILPGDTLTLPAHTVRATLTASWGVRVTFLDWDKTELRSELIAVTETQPGTAAAPPVPPPCQILVRGLEAL